MLLFTFQGNGSVVRLLLARGLDEGHRDDAGWTPLHYAAFEGHQEVREVLVEAGAKINEVDNDGKCRAWRLKRVTLT
jgi:ankyrin repeat protein